MNTNSVTTVTKKKKGKITRKPLTSGDREQYIHAFREKQGRIAWTVHKSSFGQNDILGCVDTISYTPSDIILDQTSTVREISHKRIEYRRMLKKPSQSKRIVSCVHGVDGFREKIEKKWSPMITRHVMETWLPDGTWKREEMPIVNQAPIKLKSEGIPEYNYTMKEDEQAQIVLKLSKDKNEKVVK